MKFLFFSLLIPLSAMAKDNLVTCEIQDLQTCTACEKRIPASCENHTFNGSLEAGLKPKKIQWLISNTKSGTEKWVTTDNSKLSLKDIKSEKNLKAVTDKLKLTATDKLSLASVQFSANTTLYQSQTGKEIASLMKYQGPLRNVASAQEPLAGGVRRAQQKQK